MKKSVKVVAKNKDKTDYPSAELVKTICYDEYIRVINTYDKIYDKVNIALAFSGAVLLVIVGNFDYTVFTKIFNTNNNLALFSLIVYFSCSVISCALIVYSTIRMLLLMKSRTLSVVSALDLCNAKLYNKPADVTSLWISDKYVKSIKTIKEETLKKQKVFDSTIIKTIIAVICYSVALIIQKGF